MPKTLKTLKTLKTKVEKVEKVDKIVKTKGVEVVSYSETGVKGTTTLSEAIFGQVENNKLLAQSARVFLSNQRSANAKTQTRADVSFSTAKIYRQKGTGGARHGSKSAPIFVGGGVAHGPDGQANYRLEMTKQTKKKVLIYALSEKAKAGKLIVADLDNVEPKTKKIVAVLKKIDSLKRFVLIHDSKSLYRGARNIKDATVIFVKALSPYQIMAGRTVILTKSAVVFFEKMAK